MLCLLFSYSGEMKEKTQMRGILYKNRNRADEDEIREVVLLQLLLCYAIEE